MAHHKRHRPKHQRAGCLHCKYYKDERRKGVAADQPVAVRRQGDAVAEGLLDVEEFWWMDFDENPEPFYGDEFDYMEQMFEWACGWG